MRERLKEGLDLLGIEAGDGMLDACLLFLEELKRWNAFFNLVGDGDDSSLVLHVLDSLAALEVIREHPVPRAADAGSGGGFPGIPLAIFLPGTRMTLLERSGKKAGYLRNAAALLPCPGRIDVVQEELENVTDTYGLVVSRALAAIGPGLDLLWPLTEPGGRLVFYKGKKERIQRELEQALLPVTPRVVSVTVPFSEGERHLVVFTKNQ